MLGLEYLVLFNLWFLMREPWVSRPDDATARSEPAHRGREGHPDLGAVGPGAGLDGARGAPGDAAERADEDAGQLQPAAVQGAQGEPAGEGAARRAASGQPGSGGRGPPAGRGARPVRDRQGRRVRPLPGGARRCRPGPARPLRQGRAAAGAPGGHPGGALPRPLHVLRRHDPGARARGPGGRLALRGLDPGAGALPALHPRHQLPAADPALPAPVRAADQRRRLGRPVPPRQAAVRGRGRRHPRPPAPRPGGLLRRDHGAGRRPDLLGLGVPEHEVAIHVIRPSRGRAVVAEVLGGHRPAIWVSDLYGAQRGHADLWQVRLAHQLRDLGYAVEAGDAVFAPRLKALLLRAVVLARRRHALKAGTRREYRLRLERELDRVLALRPSHRRGLRLRKRYLAVRDGLFTFLEHPEAPPDNNGSERALRPMVVYRKVTGGFRSASGPDLCAAVASGVGTAAPHRIDAHHAIHAVLSGQIVLAPG